MATEVQVQLIFSACFEGFIRETKINYFLLFDSLTEEARSSWKEMSKICER